MKTDARLIQSDALQILPNAAQSVRRSADSVRSLDAGKSEPSVFEELLDDRITSRSDSDQPTERPESQSDHEIDRPEQSKTDAETTGDAEASGATDDGADQDKIVKDHPADDSRDSRPEANQSDEQAAPKSDGQSTQIAGVGEQAVVVDRPVKKSEQASVEQPKTTSQSEQSALANTAKQTKSEAPAISESLSGLSKKSEFAREQIQPTLEKTVGKEALSESMRVNREPIADSAQSARVVKHDESDDQVGSFREQLRDRVLGTNQGEAEAKPLADGKSARESQTPTNQEPKHAKTQEAAQQFVQNTAPASTSNAAAIVGSAPVPSAIQSVLDRINGVRAMMPGANSVQSANGQPNPSAVTAVSSTGGASIGSDATNAPKLGMLRAQASHTDRGAVIAQVQRGLASMLRSGGGDMTIRLRPDHLGELKIRMHTEDGGVRASFETKTEGAREAIERGLVRLREQLESKGIRVDELRVDHREQSGAEERQSSSDEQQSNKQTPETRSTSSSVDTNDHAQQSESQHDEPRGIWTELGLDAVA